MIFDQPGRFAPGLHMLGCSAMPMYLIEARRPAIIDAGLACLNAQYAQALHRLLGDAGPALCLLTHSHFDHVGAVGLLKRRFPSMAVAASARVADVLQKPSAIDRIRHLNTAGREMARTMGVALAPDPFEPFAIDRILNDEEVIELENGLHLKVIATPGHTRDCLSYLLVERNALFVSEAAGIPDETGDIICDCLVDYDQYMDSMERIRALAVETLCLGHRGVYTGVDAASHLEAAAAECRSFYRSTAAFLRETGGDQREVMARIRRREYDPKPDPKQPEPAYLLNLEARVAAVHRSVAQSGARIGPSLAGT